MVARTPIVVEVCDTDDDGQRADVVVARRVPGLSRRIARRLALRGNLRIGGRTSPPSTRVHLGERIELTVTWSDQPVPPLRILRLSHRFVYVDKPAGVHTHRLGPEDPPALADAVTERHPECATASENPREGGAIHRLDGPTQGVVAFARNRRAWVCGRAAVAGSALKVYVARVGGAQHWPPVGAANTPLIDAEVPELPPWVPIGDPAPPIEFCGPLGGAASADTVRVRSDGRPARTRAWPLARALGQPDGWWIALRLMTGCRHQARVHLATAGWPIVGDTRYGGAPFPRLLLCAAVLQIDAEDGPVTAPAPTDWPLPP